ncbi:MULTISPECIES: YajQ family cyclic di-GMP-binding protein [Ferrimonas]|uniref:YajQ family cyclic di-GMP-binding protein n=1 Tax=Ferrimonas TaxID=44011 RepID=UPI0003F736AA|nr:MULTISPECIES: YajQ family cyclic di-GMP-binding protein [Ferrimonas]USD38553.1 YajQ family cyclic di-GMP-binding protein [Ferrimonas sp. SCSIO 43195]
MPSFDIVSEVDAVELRNAVDNASRELTTRFDFRGVEASFELSDMVVIMKAEGDFQLRQMEDILRGSLAKRKVDSSAMEVDEKAVHSGKTFSRNCKFKQGIEQAVAKKLIKAIKDSKIKVQAQIQGDKMRVTGKKRDDLQAVMALTREADLGQPFQFENFRD